MKQEGDGKNLVQEDAEILEWQITFPFALICFLVNVACVVMLMNDMLQESLTDLGVMLLHLQISLIGSFGAIS